MTFPKITIVTASLNAEGYIKRAIDSVLSQDYQNLEYIIMDGLSTDRTLEIIQSYDDSRLKWFSQKDRGLYDALNQGFVRATGEVISWLDADNFYCSPHILRQVGEAFSRDVDLAIVITNGYIWYPGLRIKCRVHPALPSAEDLINNGNRFTPECAFYKKTTFNQVGGLNADLKLLADYELWIKVFKTRPKALKLEQDSAIFTVRDEALLRKKFRASWAESFLIGEMHNRSRLARLKFRLRYLYALVRFYLGGIVKSSVCLMAVYKKWLKFKSWFDRSIIYE